MTTRLFSARTEQAARLFVCFVFCVVFLISGRLFAAQHATPNFVVTAENSEMARKVADTAERCRYDLAMLWLGVELPRWSAPCPIRVKAAPNLGAGGETSFTFKGNEVFGWKMKVQGTEERILDSVIPHEISHMILATCFRQPVPRWIDEGAATSIEADAERSNYRRMLIDFLNQQKGLPFNTMVKLKEYPADMMPFYAQGFSVCEYLIAVGGHRRLVEFARAGLASGNWSAAVQKFYPYQDLSELQLRWQAWVSAWYHDNMPAELPQVARIENYPYDIYGQPMPQSGAESATLVAANAPQAVLEPLPRRTASAAQQSVPNRSATLVASAPLNGTPNRALAYQGSYGRMTPTAAPSLVPTTAPPLDLGAGLIMLGQQAAPSKSAANSKNIPGTRSRLGME